MVWVLEELAVCPEPVWIMELYKAAKRSLPRYLTRTKNLNRTRSSCLDTRIPKFIRPWPSSPVWILQMSSINARIALVVIILTSMAVLLALVRSPRHPSIYVSMMRGLMQLRVLKKTIVVSVAEPRGRPSLGRKRLVNRFTRSEQTCLSLAIKSELRYKQLTSLRTPWPGSCSKT